MQKNNQKLPQFESTDELTIFFEENDLGEYLDSMPKAEFDVAIGRRNHYVAVDQDVVEKLSEISKTEHLTSRSLVNSWLREKLSEHALKR